MTREEAIKILKENYCAMCAYGSQDMDSCDIRNCDNKDAIQALEQEPTTKNDLGVDAILRADARSLICKIDQKHHMTGMSWKAFKDLYNGIDELPSVTPQEPKTGHWVKIHPLQADDGEAYMCSCCGTGDWGIKGTENFCPYCGEKMVEPQESEVEDE